jgi:hypothetical protein
MSLSLRAADAVTSLTQATGVSETDLSSILLVISVLAIGGAGLGLIIVCARALFARPRAPAWMPSPLESIDDLDEPASPPRLALVEPLAAVEPLPRFETPPPPPDLLPQAVEAAAEALPPPRPAVPSVHETPTLRGVAAVTDIAPETVRSGPAQEAPAAHTGPFFGEGSPLPLLSVKPSSASAPAPIPEATLETAPVSESVRDTLTPEAPVAPPAEDAMGRTQESQPDLLAAAASDGPERTVSSSGLVMAVPRGLTPDVGSFQYGARRA